MERVALCQTRPAVLRPIAVTAPIIQLLALKLEGLGMAPIAKCQILAVMAVHRQATALIQPRDVLKREEHGMEALAKCRV